ncbi:phosphatidylserine decarboxylase family protein [Nitrospira defluvii]|nr:phosphatidylserine decarboxylase family protein [Nitrospira defluvii]
MSQEKQPAIAKEGYVFIAIGFVITLLWVFFLSGLGAIFPALLTFFCIWFFRDPKRTVPEEEGLLVSPADGKVVDVCRVEKGRFLNQPAIKVSIFLNVFNVHVNRVPTAGKVLDVSYNPGRFFAANVPKASLENEQNAVLLETASGKQIVCIQIAGLIARRIVCWVKKGGTLERGERFGLIRFGSRVDLYLPPETDIRISKGDKVKGGESILGYLR